MIIETDRLVLRPWEDEDAEELYKYASDERVGPIAGWLPHTSVEDSRRVIHEVLSAPETYAVVLKETGKPAGSAGIMMKGNGSAPMTDSEAEIGYWIGVPYWGMGMIPEAVEALLERCFKELERTAVWCGYFDGNKKSMRVQQKCGFLYHHTQLVKSQILNKTMTEHFSYITRERWERRKNKWNIAALRDKPEYSRKAAVWFHDKWGIPEEAYYESIIKSMEEPAGVPQWYISLGSGGEIIGGAGVIDNDFHERKDLSPNLCALFVNEEYRCRGMGGSLLDFVCADMKRLGYEKLYLITDHKKFYERYGWKFLCMVKEDSGGLIRMYIRDTK